MPDYSQFNSRVAAAKFSYHTHSDGSIHIEIEAIFPPGYQAKADQLIKKIDEVIKTQSGAEFVQTENYLGAEADLHDEPLENYYSRVRGRDFSHEN